MGPRKYSSLNELMIYCLSAHIRLSHSKQIKLKFSYCHTISRTVVAEKQYFMDYCNDFTSLVTLKVLLLYLLSYLATELQIAIL